MMVDGSDGAAAGNGLMADQFPSTSTRRTAVSVVGATTAAATAVRRSEWRSLEAHRHLVQQIWKEGDSVQYLGIQIHHPIILATSQFVRCRWTNNG